MKADILRQIGSIARAFDSIANIEFKNMKLNRGQYLYLARIGENPGIISDQVARKLNVDRTTAARSIQKLVKQGLVYKKKKQDNQKLKHLFLTEKGKKLAQVIERENAYSNRSVLKGLNEEQQKQLAQYLTVLAANSKQSWVWVKNGGERRY